MDRLMKKYGYVPDKEKIDRSLEMIASGLDNVVSEQVLKDCFSMMDLTSLKTDDTRSSVARLVEKVNAFNDAFPGYPLPASVCVYPDFADVVRDTRSTDGLHVTVVAACFPSSQSFLEVKLKECEMAELEGALPVLLPTNILRAETAAVYSASAIQIFLNDFRNS